MQEFDIYRILTEDAHFTQVGLGFQLEPSFFDLLNIEIATIS